MTKTTKLSDATKATLGAAQVLVDQASIMLEPLRFALSGPKGELLRQALEELEHAKSNLSDVRRR